MKDENEKTVTVYDMDGVAVSMCTKRKAHISVLEGRSVFISSNAIQLNNISLKENHERRDSIIVRRDKRRCYICGRTLKRSQCTIDHIYPLSLGKEKSVMLDIKENMRCCCFKCNADKGAMPLSEYVVHIRENPDMYPRMKAKRLKALEELAENNKKEMEQVLSSGKEAAG